MTSVLPVELSFIVPARNEAWILGTTLDAVRRAAEGRFTYEIIVVDNGSTDDTAAIASRGGARVLARTEGHIGALRNEGVRESRGEILIFLDADVVVTDAWARHLPESVAALRQHAETVTGSICAVPSEASLIERTWFAPRSGAAFTHIGSGHMLTTRQFFDRVGGFDPALETGEDSDFSRRAVRAGGQMCPDASLVAEHHGFPRTLARFVMREAWHGRGDFASLGSAISSRTAIATILFAGAHLAAIASVFLGARSGIIVAAGGVGAICLGSALFKYRGQGVGIVLTNAVLFYFYYLGRAMALVDRASRGSQRRGNPSSLRTRA